MSKQAITSESDSDHQHAVKVLLCGGLAGVITWASIFPLDVIKTRVQTWDLTCHPQAETQPLLSHQPAVAAEKNIITSRLGTYHIALTTYRTEGVSPFFRGLGICSARAFFVNAVQWAVSILPPTPRYPPRALTQNKGIRMDDESASALMKLPEALTESIQPKCNHQLVRHFQMKSPILINSVHQTAPRSRSIFRLLLHKLRIFQLLAADVTFEGTASASDA